MNKIYRLMRFIAVGSFSLILTACYGVIYQIMYGVPYEMKPGTVTARNVDGEPIPGLEVTVRPADDPDVLMLQTETDWAGEADFMIEDYYETSYTLALRDTDGPANLGDFDSETRTISREDIDGDEDISIDVTMEER